MGSLAGYDTVVLDIEHGLFDLHALDWIIPLIRAKGMRLIAKVLGPERGPIQQALDFGADAVAAQLRAGADVAEVTNPLEAVLAACRALGCLRQTGHRAI